MMDDDEREQGWMKSWRGGEGEGGKGGRWEGGKEGKGEGRKVGRRERGEGRRARDDGQEEIDLPTTGVDWVWAH